MPGTSTKTRFVGFRLSNKAYSEIERLVKDPHNIRNPDNSVGDYCKRVIERYVFRHSTRKYRSDL